MLDPETNENINNINENLNYIKEGLDVCMLYMSILNNPECSQEFRDMIDSIITNYLDYKNTSLEEIRDNFIENGR